MLLGDGRSEVRHCWRKDRFGQGKLGRLGWLFGNAGDCQAGALLGFSCSALVLSCCLVGFENGYR